MHLRSLLTIIVFFSQFAANAQSVRDIFIKDSVQPVLNAASIDKADYLRLKKAIAKLEKQYGYEVNLKKRILNKAYTQNDLDFFKAELSVLVKEYGFDAAYLSGNENFYTAVMKGSLSKWFKDMYLKNHNVWLSNNFDKQTDLRKLNTINEKDQAITSFAMSVLNVQGLDSIQQQKIKILLGEYHGRNLEPVLNIATTRKLFPNDRNFAVIQNGFDSVLIHNFQFKENFDAVWAALFPYIKEAYLKHEITNVMFNNYDFYHYLHYGSQVFGSYTIEQIPEQFRKNDQSLPLKDKHWLDEIKKEFGWVD